MSKVFLPQFSSSKETPQGFSTPSLPPGGESSSVFQVQWPRLLSKENAQRVDQAAKEMEEKILRQTRERGLLIEREAYEKGFAQGEKDGLELGQKKLETIFDSFQKILAEMGRLRQDLYLKHEREMVRLVFALTRKILRQDLPLPEGWVKEALKAAFDQVLDPRKVVLHLNPKDYQYLLTHPGGLPFRQERKEEGEVKVLADPAITRGGCYVETPFDDIDATLEGQIEALISALWLKFQPSTISPGRPNP